jgi:hypothetical protein
VQTGSIRDATVGFLGGGMAVVVIYLLAGAIGRDLTMKTEHALRDAYKPGISELIYAQTMARSLEASDNPGGSPMQTLVLGLAEAMKEAEDFNVELAEYEVQSIGMASQNACIEERVLATSLENLTFTPQEKGECSLDLNEFDEGKLQSEVAKAEAETESLRRDLAEAHVQAQFEGDPGAERTVASISKKETLLSLKKGRLELAGALILVERGETQKALEIARDYAVSSQGQLQALEDLVYRLAYIVPQSQAWHLHEDQSDNIAKMDIWTDLKVSASNVSQNLAFAVEADGDEYHHLGGVEGSIRLYVEQLDAKKSELIRAEQAVAKKQQSLVSASGNVSRLREILSSSNPLSLARVQARSKSLLGVLLNVQVWHLVWGIFAGLVGSILGEYLGRIRKLMRQITARVGWTRLLHLSEDSAHPKEHDILPILGLILGTLVGIRLGDHLESLTGLLIGLAARGWLFLLVSYVVLASVAIIVGGFAGRSLIPRSSRQRITRARIYASGGSGALAGLLIFTLTKLLPMTNFFAGEQSRASFESSALALSLVGGLFGSLIGSALPAGRHSDAPGAAV